MLLCKLNHFINPLTPEPPVTAHTRLHCLTISCDHKHKNISDYCRISAFEFGQEQKLTIFNVIEKQQKSHFCLQFFLLKSQLQTQKSTFTAKFRPSPSLEVIFFGSYSLLGPSYSLSFSCILTLPRFSTS